MLKLAELTSEDVVFEPGCGDARITVAAVKAGAGRGVGIDLDPARVAEATTSVKAADLSDKIEIRLGDALDIKDLSEATVVFLYMGDDFNRLIRPLLLKHLKVGSRVVSHRFTMGDWKPDKTISRELYEDVYRVHLWTVTDEVKARAESLAGAR
jgi:cyclopropane fatty-acyl-phospholipid synthase-like methyltransferase